MILQRLYQLAHSRGGNCLSTSCTSQNQKLSWQCERGHNWFASTNSIIYSGSWCPVCAGNQKLSLAGLKELAQQRGGNCLATEYTNSKTKMLWQCQNGHQWYATAFSVKIRKSWCPECYKAKNQ
jgi:hypothetical protein